MNYPNFTEYFDRAMISSYSFKMTGTLDNSPKKSQ